MYATPDNSYPEVEMSNKQNHKENPPRYCICGKELPPYRKSACSKECRQKLEEQRREERGLYIHRCIVCGKEFSSAKKERLLCGSRECRSKHAKMCLTNNERNQIKEPSITRVIKHKDPLLDNQIQWLLIQGKDAEARHISQFKDYEEYKEYERSIKRNGLPCRSSILGTRVLK
jgi:predicted nucleic acid-binding Zn ribbon protein